MITANKLIDKLLWDHNTYGQEYIISYWDNVSKSLKEVDFKEMVFTAGNNFSFEREVDGELINIPFHRIRRVTKNGAAIWERTKKLAEDLAK